MSARDEVLGRIGVALGRAEDGRRIDLNDQPAEVSERLSAARRSTLPMVAEDLLQALTRNMESVLMSVVRLPSAADCIAAVQDYLALQSIATDEPGVVTVAPALDGLGWPTGFSSGTATGTEQVSITPCIAAVAETGSVVMASSAQTPANLNFLPETHIILVYESQVVRHVDDIFALLRLYDAMPRAINLITGPSRTADIEQTLEIGVHGPRRMHVLLIAGQPV